MQESKIVATKRLQDEGHWNEASLYREGIRETLRSEGMTRKEANRVAWEKMLEVFPPFDAEEEAAHWRGVVAGCVAVMSCWVVPLPTTSV